MHKIKNCTKCGARLRNEALFCHKCGTRIRDMVQDSAACEPDDGFDIYFAPYEEPAGSRKKKYFLSGAVVVALAVLILCFFNSNAYRCIFYKPVDYYRYVEKKNAAVNIGLISGWYKAGGLGETETGTTGYEGTFALKLSEEILTPASEAMDLGDPGFLSDIGLDLKSSSGNGLRSSDIVLSLGGIRVLTLDTIRGSGDDLYLRIPELNDDYLDLDTGAVKDLTALIRNYVPAVPEFKTDRKDEYRSVLSSLPDAVKAGLILNRYADLVFDNIEDVERSGRETLELGGVEQKCRILTVKPGHMGLMRITDAICDELKEDEDVREIINKRAIEKGEDAEEAWQDFTDGLDILTELAGTCPDLTMKVYVDRHGSIIFREIDLNDDADTCIGYGRTVNGRRFGVSMYLRNDADGNYRNFDIDGSGKKAGDNYSGDLTVAVAGLEPIDLTVDRFDFGAFKEQKLCLSMMTKVGDITDAMKVSNPAIGLIKDYLTVLSIDTEAEGTYDVTLKLADNTSEPVICTYSHRRTGGSPIAIPLGAVRVEKIPDMKDYLKSADFAGFKSTLEGAGVPESITRYIGYIEQAVDYIDFVDLLL